MKKKFEQHKRNAKRRNIQFDLSFEEWVQTWLDALGPDWAEKRGKGKNKFCMARVRDSGPYKIGNVYITTNEQNERHFVPSNKIQEWWNSQTFRNLRKGTKHRPESIEKMKQSRRQRGLHR